MLSIIKVSNILSILFKKKLESKKNSINVF